MITRMTRMLVICLLAFTLAIPIAYADGSPPKHGDILIGDLRAVENTSNSVKLEWTPAPDTVFINLHYTGAGKDQIKKLPTTSNSYTVTGLAPSTTYVFELEGECAKCQKLISNKVTVSTYAKETTSPSTTSSNVSAQGATNVKVDTNRAIVYGNALITSSSSDSNGTTTATVQVTDAAKREALKLLAELGEQAQGLVIQLEQSADIIKFEFKLDDLKAIVPQHITLSVTSPVAGYDLPLALLDYAKLAEQIGAGSEATTLTITLAKLTGAAAETLKRHAETQGFTLAGDAYDFTVTIAANNDSREFLDFGQTYVSRSIVLNGKLDGSATAVLYDPATGRFTFVPAAFAAGEGSTTAKLKRVGNSIYAVVHAKRSFTDLASGHWAKADVEFLASKLVLEGRTSTTFDPSAAISRAEFTAMLVRALGLSPNVQAAAFSDVDANQWYAGSIGAAVRAGLVRGFEDGTFLPDAPVTRLQMAVMTAAALKAVDNPIDVSGKESAIIALFSDADAIPAWAQNDVAQTVLLKIMKGNPDKAFHPGNNATRAEAAVIVKRFLLAVHFIED